MEILVLKKQIPMKQYTAPIRIRHTLDEVVNALTFFNPRLFHYSGLIIKNLPKELLEHVTVTANDFKYPVYLQM